MTKNNIKSKKRGFKRLTLEDRCLIETRYCRDLKKLKDIAEEIGRPLSTVVREIKGRPRKGMGKYSASLAQSKALSNYERQGRKQKLEHSQPLLEYIITKLKIGWSPEQISGRLPIDYPKDKTMRISYESIYAYIYNQIRREGNGNVKTGCADLRKYLSRRHTRRQKKGLRQAQKAERESNLPSIEIRPKEVEDRKSFGHWEGDTMVSRQSEERIKSLNERASGVVLFGKTKNGTATECDRVLVERLSAIPLKLRKTLTQDRGTENFGYRNVEKKLNIFCYFAHAYASYERGSNENLNGLFRRYFPKKTDFAKVRDEDIKEVEFLINSRPRKRFGFRTPLEVLFIKTGVAIEY